MWSWFRSKGVAAGANGPPLSMSASGGVVAGGSVTEMVIPPQNHTNQREIDVEKTRERIMGMLAETTRGQVHIDLVEVQRGSWTRFILSTDSTIPEFQQAITAAFAEIFPGNEFELECREIQTQTRVAGYPVPLRSTETTIVITQYATLLGYTAGRFIRHWVNTALLVILFVVALWVAWFMYTF